MKREHVFGLGLAILAAFILYLLSKSGLLHESVTSAIITPQSTVTSDPQTGYPQYDTRVGSTIPEQEAFAEPPLDTNGMATQFPKDILNCTCPIGYRKWRNVADGGIWCLPNV